MKRMKLLLLLVVLLCSGCNYRVTTLPLLDEENPVSALSTPIEEVISTESAESPSEYGSYAGYAYSVINENVPFFSDSEKTRIDAFEEYSDLDVLGRCQVAYANICKELMPTEPRGEIGSVKPTGWHTVKYSGLIDGNYLYNRCHLIGYQLAGENANEKNLITGTRYLNVVGMLPFENQVANFVEQTGYHVLYRVTPVFTGDNLVADGVLMEAYSVEDQGDGICFCVFCYNVQPQIAIDYATGNSWEDETVISLDDASDPFYSDDKETEGSGEYILNTNSKKFHKPDCSAVDKISKKNKEQSDLSKEALETKGYEPCKLCNP